MTWRDSLRESKQLVGLGSVMMSVSLFRTLVAYLTYAMITQLAGLGTVGIYSAAFALSNLFINFIISAMWTDYYPRLTAVATKKITFNRQINDQSEISLLFAIPGLLATLSLAPWVIRIFYTSEFLPSADLLQWFVLGLLGQVISYPLDCAILALGKGKWYLYIMALVNGLHLALNYVGLITVGIEGVAIAFFILQLINVFVMYVSCRHLTIFRWSNQVVKLLFFSSVILGATFLLAHLTPILPSTIIGVLATFVSIVVCMRGLVSRIGSEHRITHAICSIPGGRTLCGI
jgi:antigen flippase